MMHRQLSKLLVATTAVSLAVLRGAVAQGAPAIADRFPTTSWEHVAPTDTGWSSELLAKAEAWSQRIGSTAVMIIQHGAVVAEWGDTAAKIPLASIRKSLLSALIGIAVERHQLSLSQQIGELGIDDNAPSLTEEEKRATVQDLLEARSGIYHPALYETAGMAALRPPRGSHPPGTFWYYNNWDFNTLGAIYLHATGSSVFDALQREIAAPIGMQDYQPSDGEYFIGSASVYPAYPIQMSARDLARFALLYLHRGEWSRHQIVPARWVDESTRAYSQSGVGPGYGYLWWTGFADNSIAPAVNVPPGSYSALGYGGQFALVVPAQDMVIIHRHPDDEGPDFRQLARLVWLVFAADHVPDIGPDASIDAAPGAPADKATLDRILPGTTLKFGDNADGGPFEMKLNPDGSAVFLKGDPAAQYDSGFWHVARDQFCRERAKAPPHHACFSMVITGTNVEMFDDLGVMQASARLLRD